ncbi:MAG: acyl-CoA dehydrogenase family protein [Proteobacteria bacterium]|nr:acyl-CoA dehydrogenase family protein [Pseudomonadota bacterium]
MNFGFTPEQKMLKESAKKLMRQEVVPFLAGAPEDRPLPADEIKRLLKKLIPLGYLGSTIPEEYGGFGLDYLTYGMLLEELEPPVYGLVMLQAGTARSIFLLGNEEQKRTFLPKLLAAERIGCSCITEPNVGSNTGSIQCRAVRDGDEWVINGTKTWITNGAFADLAFVLANADPSQGKRGLARFILDKDVSPWEANAIGILSGDGQIPSVGELVFEDCRVPGGNLLGEFGRGLKDTLIGFQAARCYVALDAINIAQRALDAAIRYARERTQFGRPIGKFQMVQAMIAEMAMELDASRLLAYRGLSLVDRGLRCARETSMAKFYATEAAVRITSKAIQVHGAYGLSREYPVERLFRHARVLPIPDGTTQIQKLIVAREILGLQAFA